MSFTAWSSGTAEGNEGQKGNAMVREVKLSCDIGRSETPVCRDSVLDDGSRIERPRRPAARRRRKAEPRAAAAGVPPARPATERRHLAGADWLSGYLPSVRKAK